MGTDRKHRSGITKIGRRREEDKKIDARELMTDEELGLKEMDEIPRKIEDIERVLEEKTGLNVSFDLVFRVMEFGTKRTDRKSVV